VERELVVSRNDVTSLSV